MRATDLPKLRRDLVVSEKMEGSQTVYILKDPQTDRFFRLKKVEYLIASQFDGTLSISELTKHLKDILSLQISEEVLSKFVGKLAAHQLLDPGLTPPASEEKQDAPPPSPHQAFEGKARKSRFHRLLYFKVARLDPDRFFERTLPRVKFFYTKSFVGFAVFTILFALGITINNWEEISREAVSLFSAHSVLFALLVMMPIIVFHEMAHGMTCKHYGGKVREMGFLFLYFQPSCYCNVSDSYLFKERAQRIWVMAAGVFIQTFLWAVLTILWRILSPETMLAHLVFITIAVSGVITLFQFNPLLKLDGYYILAELSSIPNLRTKSFRYLGTKVRSLFAGDSAGTWTGSRRDRRIYWSYGLIALVYSINFLGYFALKLERYLVDQYQGTGFILFWGVALFVAGEPLVQAVGNRLPKTTAKEKHRAMAKHKNLFVTSFLCLGGVLVLTLGRWELKVSNECVLIPYERADVRAEVAGIIDTIYFDEGQTVHAGNVIARLAEYQYNSNKAKILAQISEAQARLQLMLAGPSKEEIAVAQSMVDSSEASVRKAETQIPIAKERADFAAKNFERSQRMFEEKLLASMSLDEAKRDLNLRQRELVEVQHDVEEKQRQLQEAKKSFAKVMAGARPEEIQAKRAEIDGLMAQEKLLEVESGYTAIRSPIDGVITTHFLKQKEKAFLQQGEVICQVANTKKIITEIPVPEKEVGDVHVGYPVKLKANAFPKMEFDGRVTQISDIADQQDPNVRVVMVRSEINNPDLLLKPQMTGYAKIYCGTRTLGELASRRTLRFIRTEFWSWF